MSENGEIYTAGKKLTLPPAVTAWTNLTSANFLYNIFYVAPFLSVMYLQDYIGIVGFRVWGRWCDRLRVTLNWRKLRANNSSSVCLSTTQGKTRSTKDFWEKKVEWETQFQIEIRVRTTKRIEKSTRSGHDHIEREVLWVKDGHTSCISSYSLSDNHNTVSVS